MTSENDELFSLPESFITLSASIGTDFNNCEQKDIFQVLYKNLQKVLTFFHAERVILYILDPDVNISVIEVKNEQAPSHAGWKKDGFSIRLPGVFSQLNSGEAVISDDILSDSMVSSSERLLLENERIQSVLWIPLQNRCKCIACIELATFSKTLSWKILPQAYYSNLAVLFTALLERKRNEDENDALYKSFERSMQAKNNELTTILNIQKVLTAELHIKQVIQLVSDEIRRLTNAKFSSVCLLNNGKMTLQVVSGNLSGKLSLGCEIPLVFELSEQSLISGSALRIKDDDHLPQVYREALRLTKTNSLLVMPLVSATNLIGMISITDVEDGPLKFEEERLLKMFANIAIIAVDNARSYQEEQNRREEAEKGKRIAEALRDILRILNSNMAIEIILDYIAIQSRDLLQATSTMIRKIDYEKGTVFTEASSNLPGKFDVIKEIPFYPGGSERILKENIPVAIPNLQESLGRYLRDMEELSNPQRDWVKVLLEYYKSHLIIPLIINDDLYGTLTFYFDQVTYFSEEDLHVAKTLGTQVSLAIENARLRKQEKEIAVATERNRLARDLHDAVTQTLFSATLIAEVLPRVWAKDQNEGLRRLDELRQLTRGALAEMRTLLLELRPSALQDASFEELLTQLSEAFNGRSRLPVDLQIETHALLPIDVKMAFYRITQEALNNIAKHANATCVQITYREFEETFSVAIKDDGIGMEILDVPSNHLGLGIMRERAQNIGAELKISSRAGYGTEIKLFWKKDVLPEKQSNQTQFLRDEC